MCEVSIQNSFIVCKTYSKKNKDHHLNLYFRAQYLQYRNHQGLFYSFNIKHTQIRWGFFLATTLIVICLQYCIES